MVLPELYQSREVLYFLIEAPLRVDKHSSFERHGVLLLCAVGEHLIILLVVDDLVEKVPVAELYDGLLGATDFCE